MKHFLKHRIFSPSSLLPLPFVWLVSSVLARTDGWHLNAQLNIFHSGLFGRFEDSIENKVHKNTYPEGWYYDTDMASCFKTVQEPICA